MNADTITILRARGRRLAKLIRPGGIVQDYDSARTFDLIEHPVSDLDSLVRLLCRLMPRPDCAVVRGEIIDPARTCKARRLVHPDPVTGDAPTLREHPHRWLALDLDGVPLPAGIDARDLPGCAEAARAALPPAFHGARAVVTASASHSIKPGLRLRYWCWCARPVSGPELARWLDGAAVDNSVFRPAQPIYTATPVFVAGAVDPLPTRLAVLRGAEVVNVPPPDVLHPPPPRPRAPLPRPTCHAPGLGPASPRMAAAIAWTLARLEMSGQGQRHDRLRAAACTLGGLMDEAGFSSADAERVLFDAVKRAGGNAVVERNARATIAWGLNRGRRAPLRLEDR